MTREDEVAVLTELLCVARAREGSIEAALRVVLDTYDAARRTTDVAPPKLGVLANKAARGAVPVDELSMRRCREIIAAHAAASGFTVEEVVGPGRPARLAAVRHEAIIACFDAGAINKTIAVAFHRDHSTIVGVRRAHQERMRAPAPRKERVARGR